MVMRTLIVFDGTLKHDTPEIVDSTLAFMVDFPKHWDEDGMALDEFPDRVLPDHSLFRTWRWAHLMTGKSPLGEPNRYSFVGRRLRFQSHVKDYDDYIERFLDWVGPWIDPAFLPRWNHRPFVGRVRYEEDPESWPLLWTDGSSWIGPVPFPKLHPNPGRNPHESIRRPSLRLDRYRVHP